MLVLPAIGIIYIFPEDMHLRLQTQLFNIFIKLDILTFLLD